MSLSKDFILKEVKRVFRNDPVKAGLIAKYVKELLDTMDDVELERKLRDRLDDFIFLFLKKDYKGMVELFGELTGKDVRRLIELISEDDRAERPKVCSIKVKI